MKILRASTFEVDEPELAVSEILRQLDLGNSLLAHSVGIVTCHPDFLESGVLAAVSAALPFRLAGCTSLASATDGDMGIEILTLAVLTSDSVRFTTVLTESLWDDQVTPLNAAYDAARAGLPDNPSLILMYQPMMNHVGGEKLAMELSGISGGVPLFGTLACDHTYDFRQAYAICDGKYYKDRLAMVLLNGPLSPVFFHIALEAKDQLVQKAVITASAGNVLKTVNGMPAAEYLRSLGLSSDSAFGTVVIPFLLDYNDGGQPVCRGLFLSTEEGWVVCGGDVPEGVRLFPVTMDEADVMRTTGKILDAIVAAAGGSEGLLIVSCNSRSLVLGTEPLGEMELVRARLGGALPYHMLYSGGEICPVRGEGEGTRNRFHNFTFTACLF